MNCENVRDQLPLFAYGDLVEADMADVEKHLSGCADCRNALANYEQLRHMLDETDCPNVLVDSSRFATFPTPRGVSPWWRFSSLAMAACLALVLVTQAEFQLDRGQFTMRWGRPAQPATLTAALPKQLDDRLNELHGLTIALAQDIADRDNVRRSEYEDLARRVNHTQRLAIDRVSATERDLEALYHMSRSKKD